MAMTYVRRKGGRDSLSATIIRMVEAPSRWKGYHKGGCFCRFRQISIVSKDPNLAGVGTIYAARLEMERYLK